MKTTTAQEESTRPSGPMVGPIAAKLALLVGTMTVALATLTACGPVGVHSYKAFASAVDHGASCADLIDMKQHFHLDADLVKINADLARIGCTSAKATRTDQ